jgi:hypothetical protein
MFSQLCAGDAVGGLGGCKGGKFFQSQRYGRFDTL